MAVAAFISGRNVNDDERKQIAKNGHDRIKKEHTYDIRIPAMLKIAGVL